jgi:hypothetical protein
MATINPEISCYICIECLFHMHPYSWNELQFERFVLLSCSLALKSKFCFSRGQ